MSAGRFLVSLKDAQAPEKIEIKRLVIEEFDIDEAVKASDSLEFEILELLVEFGDTI